MDDLFRRVVGHNFKVGTNEGTSFAPHRILREDGTRTLVYIFDTEERDQHYVFIDRETMLVSTFNKTGLIESIHRYEAEDIVPIATMPSPYAYGIFLSTQNLEHIVNQVYDNVRKLPVSGEYDVFHWTYDIMIRRFREFSEILSNRITPDVQGNSIVVPVAGGCFRGCFFCPESEIALRLYAIEEIQQKIDMIKAFVDKFHHGQINLFDEVFFNANDIMDFMYFVKADGRNIVSLDAIRGDFQTSIPEPLDFIFRYREKFPSLEKKKTSAFVSTPGVLWLKNNFSKYREYYLKRALNSSYSGFFSRHQNIFSSSNNYMSALFSPNAINRGYIGIETLDDVLSFYVMGKPVTASQKTEAIHILLDETRMEKLKTIVQIGYGMQIPTKSGLYSREDILSATQTTAEALARLAKRYNNSNRLRFTVEVSMYLPMPGTKLYEMRGRDGFVDYKDTERESRVEEEADIFRKAFKKVGMSELRFDYENALLHPSGFKIG
ncbi:MAG: hypothetical protein ABIJ34_05770 [archaeon]